MNRSDLPILPGKLPVAVAPRTATKVLGFPILEPRVGIKTKAIRSDAVNIAIKVIGRNFMNSPTIPGQNINGMNAASVVAVEAIMGPAIRLAATR